MHSWIHKKTKGDPGTRNVRRIGTSLSRWLSELIRSLGFNTFREAGAQTRSQNEGEELGKRPCVPSVKGEWGETSLMAQSRGNRTNCSGFGLFFVCFALILSLKLRLVLHNELGVQNVNHLPGWRTPRLRN